MWGRLLTFLVTRVLARLFPDRYRVIPRRGDGEPLLRQFKIFNWLYLQSFLNAEEKNLFHVHRWRKMYSIVLSGEFQEERFPGISPYPDSDDIVFTGPLGGAVYLKVHKAPSVYSMDSSDIHRLNFVQPNTWTAFFMFGNHTEWGYYPRPADPGYVTWDRAIPDERKIRAL